jgi:hypothetical protein
MLKIQGISNSCPTFPKNKPAKRLMIHRLWAECSAGGTRWSNQQRNLRTETSEMCLPQTLKTCSTV